MGARLAGYASPAPCERSGCGHGARGDASQHLLELAPGGLFDSGVLLRVGMSACVEIALPGHLAGDREVPQRVERLWVRGCLHSILRTKAAVGSRRRSTAVAGRPYNRLGPLAQLVEQGTFNPKVTGAIPVRPIILPFAAAPDGTCSAAPCALQAPSPRAGHYRGSTVTQILGACDSLWLRSLASHRRSS